MGARRQRAPGRPPRLLIAVTDSMALLLLRGQLRAAREQGFEVTVLSNPGETATRIAAAEDVPHLPVLMERGMAPLRDLAALWRLVGELRVLGPDVVDASTPKAGLLVLLAAWLTGVPCRVHTLRGLRFETTGGATRMLLSTMTRLTCALAQRVICISPSLRQRALELGMVDPDKAVVLGAGSSNGIDLDRFTACDVSRARARELRRELRIGVGDPVMGFVGRLARDKGFIEMAEAWCSLRERYPRLCWLIIGPPDDTDPVPPELIEQLADDPRVFLLGRRDDTVPLYLAMDVLVLPTYREGFGNVLIEAAALEIPVVATAVTGCLDAVADGENGILVPPRDAGALAAAVARYLDSPELRARHGRAGRARTAALFAQEQLWARLHGEYRMLLRHAGLHRADERELGREASV